MLPVVELNRHLSIDQDKLLLPITGITIATATILTAVSLWKTIWTHKDTFPVGCKKIPSPDGALPYFGHIFQIGDELPALKFNEWHKKYGPLISVQMGAQPWIIIGNRLLANDILKVQGSKTSNRAFYPFLDYYSINHRGMTFTDPDVRWKRSRAVAQMILAPKNVLGMEKLFQEEGTRVTNLLVHDTAKKGKIDIVKYMQFGSLNVILQMCFGIHATSVDDPLFKSIVGTIETTLKWGSPNDDLGYFIPLYTKIMDILMMRGVNSSKRRYEEFIYKIRDPLFRRLIKEARESDSSNPCFVKELYKVKEENEFEEEDIFVFVADLINAGTDTSAITMSWAFVTLSHYPEVQKRIRDEVDAFIIQHHRLPTYEDRSYFPYLISVQKESMRFRPTNHLGIPHKSTKDVICQGYFIPKGSVLMAHTYALNLDPEMYDEPEKFIPERYLGDLTPYSASVNLPIDKREQFMFGWGRRTCPGVHFADVEIFNYWVRIFATTIIEPPLDHEGNPVYPDLDARRDDGLAIAPLESHIRFIKRDDCLI